MYIFVMSYRAQIARQVVVSHTRRAVVGVTKIALDQTMDRALVEFNYGLIQRMSGTLSVAERISQLCVLIPRARSIC